MYKNNESNNNKFLTFEKIFYSKWYLNKLEIRMNKLVMMNIKDYSLFSLVTEYFTTKKIIDFSYNLYLLFEFYLLICKLRQKKGRHYSYFSNNSILPFLRVLTIWKLHDCYLLNKYKIILQNPIIEN